jgi:hypothetical protein
VRGYLARVVENLPCGVLVVSATEQVQIINPEARRLLAVTAEWVAAGRAGGLPPAFSSQGGHWIRPRPDSNRARRRLPDWRNHSGSPLSGRVV